MSKIKKKEKIQAENQEKFSIAKFAIIYKVDSAYFNNNLGHREGFIFHSKAKMQGLRLNSHYLVDKCKIGDLIITENYLIN